MDRIATAVARPSTRRVAERRLVGLANTSLTRFLAAVSLGALLTAATTLSPAQAQNTSPSPTVSPTVPNGTRFLVRLDDELSTHKHKANKKFKARTLEPLQTADGSFLPPGAEIRGHISRVEPAGITGTARMWLTFDEIRTPSGKLPLVADVVKIEARTSKGRRDIEAAAAGAAVGAVVGATAKGGKGAGIGAAAGGVAGFLISTGLGQELDLPKGTKLELELGRPLYLAKQ